MSDYTPIYFPPTLQYPVTIVKIHAFTGDEVKPHTTIVSYKYFDYEPIALSEESDEKSDERERKLKRVEYIGSFECPLEGKLVSLHVQVGDIVEDSKFVVADIEEPCSHSTQYGGLCALCGKSIEDLDYTGFNDKDRAPIVMAHGTTNLKVSAREAENIEKNSTIRLLKEKRLSLVVDLDQTVIHATVDPTVGEWMTDPTNPNYDQVKDVKAFSLEEDVIMPPGYKGPPPPQNIRWYYVKLRPGLKEFFEKVSQMYELHIYTMATRAYAISIAKIIDPDGKYFGDRILSRDESGSLTQKSLKRLFPADTSMVVVIDDRGDVWNWSPNLIKVVPYDFFVGIGDINSSFLPRRFALMGPSKRRKSVATLEDQINSLRDGVIIENANDNPSAIAEEEENGDIMEIGESKEEKAVDESEIEANTTKIFKEDDQESINNGAEGQDILLDNSTEKNDDDNNNDDNEEKDDNQSTEIEVDTAKVAYSPVDRMLEMSDSEDLLAVQESERTEVLEIQQHERPLAKLQENLDKILVEEETKNHTEEKHNLLYDDDTELSTLGQSLYRLHDEFFREIEKSENNEIPDVKDIMTYMKNMVFKEYVFLFSGIIPFGTRLENADIVIWVKSFGATVVSNYSNAVTHVICRNTGTFKPRLAKTINPDVKLVHPDWLFKCIAEWEKVEESDFTLTIQDNLLLSESEIEDYKKTHNLNGDSAFDLDWDEMDKELEDFLHSGSDDDDDDDDELESKDGESEADNESTAVNRKRSLEDSEDEETEKKQKVVGGDEEKEDGEDAEASDDDVDEFEKELLQGFADFENEEEGEGNNKQDD